MKWRGAALAFAVSVATSAMFVAPAPPAAAAPCAFAPASIAVIVDFGDGSPVSAVCVPASSSDNGAVVLAARAEQLGTPPPRYASSGLLCAIDGYPADGCGEQRGDSYAYWSYWHGTGSSWDYQNIGPGASRVHDNVVEGWRFQPDGAGNPSDPPPDGSPDATVTCAPSTTTTTTTMPPATTADAPPATSPAPQTSTVSTGAAPSTTSSGEVSSSSTTSSTAVGRTAPTASGSVRVNASSRSGSSSAGSPWAAIGAGIAIAGLATAGVLMARRRSASPP